MKIIKSIAFFPAFLIGCLFAFSAQTDSEAKKTSPAVSLPPVPSATVFSETKNAAKPAPEFAPEILGVPDFPEVEPEYKLRLIDMAWHVNSYRKEENTAKSGETWLGLFRKNDSYHLLKTKIKVRPEAVPGGGKDDETVVIKTDKSFEPFLLLKNARNLRAGKVTTLFARFRDEEFARASEAETERLSREFPLLKAGFVREFYLDARKYTFRVKKGLMKTQGNALVLVLESEGKSQIIHTISYAGEGEYVGELLWVGDLDRDGGLDLYMNFYDYEKGSYGAGLFLSSEAEANEIVKQVADFSTMGC